MRRCSALLATAYLGVLADPIIVPPVKEHGSPKLLLFVPGGKVPPEDYLPMIEATQARSRLRLSAAIVRCHMNLCDPVFELGGLMQDAIREANSSGTLIRSDIFVVGHSLGGVGARHFFDAAGDYAGLAQFGTQTNGDHEDFKGTLGYPVDLAAFPRPFLTIAGELDMLPISHVAALVSQASKFNAKDRLLKVPVLVPGMDHSQFCSPFRVSGDIKPEISDKNATETIAEILSAWLDHVSLGAMVADSADILEGWISRTASLAEPFLRATEADRTWCSETQQMLAEGLASQVDLGVTVEEKFSSSSLEHCHPNITAAGGRLMVTVCTYAYHSYLNATIPSFLPKYQGADDIGCKMVSEDKIAEMAKLAAPNMSSPAVRNKCSYFNKAALKRAKQLVGKSWPAALDRFSAQAKRILFADDGQALIGPQWLLTGLSVADSGAEITVQSEALISPLNSSIYPGNHYCKLLAPSKAVEIVMTTALTERYTTQGTPTLVI